jgi:site-specific DNA recombinase
MLGQPERPFRVFYMTTDKSKIKYFAYVRKSSEGEERQALSIPAQKDKLSEVFANLDIEFIEDKASAFKPFNRPNFAKMLETIRKRTKNGAHRLASRPIIS